MASLPIYNRSGQQVGTYEIDPAELAPRISRQLLHDVVVMYHSNLRHGTAKSKTRSEVAGTTKKMYRQKGTGNARAGSRRSPVRRGGGHTFAKSPRDWYFRLPRKAIQAATRMALAARIADNEVTLVDELSFAQPKTKEMAGVLAALGAAGGLAPVLSVWEKRKKKLQARKPAKAGEAAKPQTAQPMMQALKLCKHAVLVATAAQEGNVYKSARNISGVSVMPVGQLNALQLLLPRALLMTPAALDAFRAKANKSKPAAASQPADAQ